METIITLIVVFAIFAICWNKLPAMGASSWSGFFKACLILAILLCVVAAYGASVMQEAMQKGLFK